MASLENIVSYFINHHPDKQTLSADKLKLLVYLADWKSALEYGRQLTNIVWEIKDGRLFVPRPSYEKLNLPKTRFSYIRYLLKSWLSVREKQSKLRNKETFILDFVVKSTAGKNWEDLLQLIYSTYPTIGEQQVDELNLESMASNYKSRVRPLFSGSYKKSFGS